MAPKKEHQPGYSDPDSYRNHFMKVVKGDSTAGKKIAGFGAVAAVASLLGAGMASIFTGEFMDEPLPIEDHDTYTGIFNQNQRYSFYTPQAWYHGLEGGLFLMENEEGVALYKIHDGDEQRLRYIDSEEEALEEMREVIEGLQIHVHAHNTNAMDIPPYQDARTKIASCEYVSAPFEYAGGVERFLSDHYDTECERVSGNAPERLAVYEENLAMWQRNYDGLAGDTISYGYNSRDIEEMDYETAGDKFLERFLLTLGGLTGGAAVLTAHAAAVNRRKSIKGKQPSRRP